MIVAWSKTSCRHHGFEVPLIWGPSRMPQAVGDDLSRELAIVLLLGIVYPRAFQPSPGSGCTLFSLTRKSAALEPRKQRRSEGCGRPEAEIAPPKAGSWRSAEVNVSVTQPDTQRQSCGVTPGTGKILITEICIAGGTSCCIWPLNLAASDPVVIRKIEKQKPRPARS